MEIILLSTLIPTTIIIFAFIFFITFIKNEKKKINTFSDSLSLIIDEEYENLVEAVDEYIQKKIIESGSNKKQYIYSWHNHQNKIKQIEELTHKIYSHIKETDELWKKDKFIKTFKKNRELEIEIRYLKKITLEFKQELNLIIYEKNDILHTKDKLNFLYRDCKKIYEIWSQNFYLTNNFKNKWQELNRNITNAISQIDKHNINDQYQSALSSIEKYKVDLYRFFDFANYFQNFYKEINENFKIKLDELNILFDEIKILNKNKKIFIDLNKKSEIFKKIIQECKEAFDNWNTQKCIILIQKFYKEYQEWFIELEQEKKSLVFLLDFRKNKDAFYKEKIKILHNKLSSFNNKANILSKHDNSIRDKLDVVRESLNNAFDSFLKFKDGFDQWLDLGNQSFSDKLYALKKEFYSMNKLVQKIDDININNDLLLANYYVPGLEFQKNKSLFKYVGNIVQKERIIFTTEEKNNIKKIIEIFNNTKNNEISPMLLKNLNLNMTIFFLSLDKLIIKQIFYIIYNQKINSKLPDASSEILKHGIELINDGKYMFALKTIIDLSNK